MNAHIESQHATIPERAREDGILSEEAYAKTGVALAAGIDIAEVMSTLEEIYKKVGAARLRALEPGPRRRLMDALSADVLQRLERGVKPTHIRERATSDASPSSDTSQPPNQRPHATPETTRGSKSSHSSAATSTSPRPQKSPGGRAKTLKRPPFAEAAENKPARTGAGGHRGLASDGESAAVEEVGMTVAKTPPGGVPVRPTGADAFAALAANIRERLDRLEGLIAGLFKEVLAIADLFAEAQRAHAGARKANPESIPGSFVAAMAEQLHRSDSFIEKYLRISKIDPERRALIEAHPRIAGDLTAVLEVARAADTEAAAELVMTYEDGGRPAFNGVMAANTALAGAMRADPGFRLMMRQFVDPRRPLGGINPDLAVPADLVSRHPALRPYESVGALRRAVIACGSRGVGRRAPAGTLAQDLDPDKVIRLIELGAEEPQLAQHFSECLVQRALRQCPDSNAAPTTLHLDEGKRPVAIPTFANLGEFRAAIRAAGFAKLAEAEERGTRKHHRTGVTGSMVSLVVDVDQKVPLRCGDHHIRVRRIMVKREALEKALADTADAGGDEEGAARHRHPPIEDAIVFLTVR